MKKPELPDTAEYVDVRRSNVVVLDGWFSYDDLLKIVKYMEWLKESENA